MFRSNPNKLLIRFKNETKCVVMRIVNGAQGQNRTADTVIFSHVLYQLSYLGAGPDYGAHVGARFIESPPSPVQNDAAPKKRQSSERVPSSRGFSSSSSSSLTGMA